MSLEIDSVAQSCCHLCHPWQRTEYYFLHKFRVVPGLHILLLFLCPVLHFSRPACPAILSKKRKASYGWSKPPELKVVPLTYFQLLSPRDPRSFRGTTHLLTSVARIRLIPCLSTCRPKWYLNTTTWTIYLGEKVIPYQLVFSIYLCVPSGTDEADYSSDVMTAKGAVR